MEFQAVVRKRRMVRAFEDRPIPTEDLDRILANALHAPSAGFSQGWAFVVLTEPDDRRLFWDCVSTLEWRETATLPTAPVIILPLANRQAYLDRYREPDKAVAGMQEAESWPAPYWDIDTGMASLLMLLTAVDAGIGALFAGIPRGQDELLERLGVPPDYKPIGVIYLGYPAPDRPSPSLKRGRKPVDEVIHWGRWGVRRSGD